MKKINLFIYCFFKNILVNTSFNSIIYDNSPTMGHGAKVYFNNCFMFLMKKEEYYVYLIIIILIFTYIINYTSYNLSFNGVNNKRKKMCLLYSC